MADATRPLDKYTLQQLEYRFIQLCIGNQADTRRELLATLNLSFDELCKQANTAKQQDIETFQRIFDSGVVYSKSLHEFGDLLDLALERIANAFNENNSE